MKKIRKLFILSITFGLFCIDLFAAVKNAKNPQIITNSTGQYVYVIWIKNNGTNDIVQTTTSSDYGATWATQTNLSQSGQNAQNAYLTRSSTGQYIYAIWTRSDGLNDIAQFSSSNNYSSSWSSPVDLSTSGQDALTPDIITNTTGQYVYNVWTRDNLIQFKKSSDYGLSWSSTTDLSASGQAASSPKITTDINGSCVCALWVRSNGTNDIVQFKHSEDNGDNWDSTVNLSETGEDAKTPQIKTNQTTICATWTRENNSVDIAQFSKSTDNGITWSETYDLSPGFFSPIAPKMVMDNNAQNIYIGWYKSNGKYTAAQVVTSNYAGNYWTGPIILSQYGGNAVDTRITTDSSGQYVYAVWTRYDTANNIIQVSISNNYGSSSSWTTPVDLSEIGVDSKNPQITTNDNGKEVYVTWARFDGAKDVIRFSYSRDYGITWSSPTTISESELEQFIKITN